MNYSWTERFTFGINLDAENCKPIPVLPPPQSKPVQVLSPRQALINQTKLDDKKDENNEGVVIVSESFERKKPRKATKTKKVTESGVLDQRNVASGSRNQNPAKVDPFEVKQSKDPNLVGSQRRLQAVIEMVMLSAKNGSAVDDQEEYGLDDLDKAEYNDFSEDLKVKADEIIKTKSPAETFGKSSQEEAPKSEPTVIKFPIVLVEKLQM